jgi:hypothetical protein
MATVNRCVVELRAGSHLYGTATPASDTDLKAVYLPAARDILLQRARPTVTEERAKQRGERNLPGDVDRESYSLQRFLDFVLAGQPLALEMLFAPDAVMTMPPDPLWRAVQALAPHLVSRQATPFMRYCRLQAERYGSKGARAAAARHALALLEAAHGTTARLAVVEPTLAAFASGTPHAALIDLPVGGGRDMRHLELCCRKVPLHASIKAAREMAARLLAEYGARTLLAEQGGGVDWKALSHAVRVGQEAIELLTTGRLVFPLAGAGHLLEIKLGQVSYEAVADEIVHLLRAVESAAATSTLPDEPDREAAEDLVLQAYRQHVLTG